MATQTTSDFTKGIGIRDRVIDACTDDKGNVDWNRVNNAVYHDNGRVVTDKIECEK